MYEAEMTVGSKSLHNLENVPKQQSEINGQLKSLDYELETLRNNILELKENIYPVLRNLPEVPCNGVDAKELKCDSALGTEISNKVNFVKDLNLNVRDIIRILAL